MSVEDRIKDLERMVSELSRNSAGQFVRIAGGGGGGSDGGGNISTFAIVTDPAGASTHGKGGIIGGTVGKCILLDEDKVPTVIVDPLDDDYVEATVTAAEIEFKSNHRVSIGLDTIIVLDSTELFEPGSSFADLPVWGSVVDAVDELYRLTGAAPETSLVIPTGGDAADDIKWQTGSC